MADLRWIAETFVDDGKGGRRLVRPGDMVDLLPPPKEKRGHKDDLYSGKYESLRKFLGKEGPYKISRIGLWPCGRAMLYFHLPGGEPGAHASDFRCVTA